MLSDVQHRTQRILAKGPVRTIIEVEDNGWTVSVNNLPTKINGQPVTYSWTEQEAVGYVKGAESVSGTTTIFTNHLPKIPTVPEDQPQPKVPGESWVIFEEYETALGGELLINHVGDCFD